MLPSDNTTNIGERYTVIPENDKPPLCQKTKARPCPTRGAIKKTGVAAMVPSRPTAHRSPTPRPTSTPWCHRAEVLICRQTRCPRLRRWCHQEDVLISQRIRCPRFPTRRPAMGRWGDGAIHSRRPRTQQTSCPPNRSVVATSNQCKCAPKSAQTPTTDSYLLRRQNALSSDSRSIGRVCSPNYNPV